MERGYDLVSEITNKKETWRLKVKVVRLWTQPMRKNDNEISSINLILMDEQGMKVHAIVSYKYLKKFRNLFQENRVYFIKNFKVGDAVSQFMMVENEQNINLYTNTTVRISQEANDQFGSGLTFVNFTDLLNSMVVTKYPLDYIGEIVARGRISESTSKDGRLLRKLKFHIMDIGRNQIEVVLWNEFAMQVNNYFEDPNYAGRVVVLVQMGKLHLYNSKPQLQSCFYGTRVWINADMPEINDFRQRLAERDGDVDANYRVPLFKVEQAASQTEDTSTLMERTNIIDVEDIKQDSICMLLATIRSLELEHGWMYFAHRKCNKKAEAIDEVNYSKVDYPNTRNQPYHCGTCKSFVSDVLPRFKVQYRVQDNTGSLSVVLFDREVTSVIHKTADELYAKQDDEDDLVPKELDEFINKQYLFKLEISKKWNVEHKIKVFTVKTLTTDDEVIKEFITRNEVHQETMSLGDASVGTDSVSQHNGSYKEVKSGTGENVQSADLFKSTADSPSTKRAMEQLDDDGTGQCSTTKRKLKMSRINETM